MALVLQRVTGDVVKVSADFIVNASNTKLILGSGVSLSFRRHCGVSLQQDMDQARAKILDDGHVIQQGDVIATSAGKATNFKYALHAAVMNYATGLRQHEKMPTLEVIEKILRNSLPYLDWFLHTYHKDPTVAFPYLGCGVGGLEKQDVLQVFEQFVHHEIEFTGVFLLCDYQ